MRQIVWRWLIGGLAVGMLSGTAQAETRATRPRPRITAPVRKAGAVAGGRKVVVLKKAPAVRGAPRGKVLAPSRPVKKA